MLKITRSPEAETAFSKALSDNGRCVWTYSASDASFKHYITKEDFMLQTLVELDKIRDSNAILKEMLVELRRMRTELVEINEVLQEKTHIHVMRER